MMHRQLKIGSAVLVPTTLRRVPKGLWLYAACKPLPVALSKTVGYVSRVDTRLIPGRRRDWSPPLPEHDWGVFLGKASDLVGTRIAHVVAQLPSDPRRRRFNTVLLDEEADPVAFAKFTVNPLNHFEIEAMALLNDAAPQSFIYPVLLEAGSLGEWTYRISRHLPPLAHGPAWLSNEDRRRIVAEIQAITAPIAANGDYPVHGDFAPWNVRRLSDGRIAIVDWEEMTTGPKGADDVWDRVNQSMLKGRSEDQATADVLSMIGHITASELRQAAQFWIERHERPEPDEVSGDHVQSASQLQGVYRLLAVLDAVVAA